MSSLAIGTKSHALKCVLNVFWNDFESCKRQVAMGNGLDANQKQDLKDGLASIVDLGSGDFVANLSETDAKILQNWGILA